MCSRILFVDDDENILAGLERMLRPQRGTWDMRFVGSAEQALAELAAQPFDVVVSDVGMPGMDGFALLLAIRESERTRDIPFIVLTGMAESDIKRRALELGATDLLTKPVSREDLAARLRNALRLKARQDEVNDLNESLEEKVRERTVELQHLQHDIIWRLAKAAEYRDEETGNHVMRVACYSQVLAQELAAPADFVQHLFLTSPLHDVGKIGISDSILLKPGKLSADEFLAMQRHCAIGAAILREYPKGIQPFLLWRAMTSSQPVSVQRNPILEMASSVAMTHHERWDGKGYPKGLCNEAIPLEGRIVGLADVFDALSLARPYKPSYPEERTLAIIREEAGHHFAPDVYAAFERQIERFRWIRTVYAGDSAWATSGAEQNETDSLR